MGGKGRAIGFRAGSLPSSLEGFLISCSSAIWQGSRVAGMSEELGQCGWAAGGLGEGLAFGIGKIRSLVVLEGRGMWVLKLRGLCGGGPSPGERW